jgi:hypothetical protein
MAQEQLLGEIDQKFSISLQLTKKSVLTPVRAIRVNGIHILPTYQVVTVFHRDIPKVEYGDISVYLSDQLIANHIELTSPQLLHYSKHLTFTIKNNSNDLYIIPQGEPYAVICTKRVTRQSIEHMQPRTKQGMLARFNFHEP